MSSIHYRRTTVPFLCHTYSRCGEHSCRCSVTKQIINISLYYSTDESPLNTNTRRAVGLAHDNQTKLYIIKLGEMVDQYFFLKDLAPSPSTQHTHISAKRRYNSVKRRYLNICQTLSPSRWAPAMAICSLPGRRLSLTQVSKMLPFGSTASSYNDRSSRSSEMPGLEQVQGHKVSASKRKLSGTSKAAHDTRYWQDIWCNKAATLCSFGF